MKRALFAALAVMACATMGCVPPRPLIPTPGTDCVDASFPRCCPPMGMMKGHPWPVDLGLGHGLGCNEPAHCACYDNFGKYGDCGGPGGGDGLAPAPGPSAGAVGYPYYTTRGPRDFFLDNPPSIGP